MKNLALISVDGDVCSVNYAETPDELCELVLKEKKAFIVSLNIGGETHKYRSDNEDRFDRQIAAAFIKFHVCQKEMRDFYQMKFKNLEKISKRHAWS